MPKTTEVDSVVGRNLRTLRQRGAPGDPFERTVSQTDVAARMVALGHATWLYHTVSAVERGTRAVLLSEALALAAMFNVDLGELIQEPG